MFCAIINVFQRNITFKDDFLKINPLKTIKHLILTDKYRVTDWHTDCKLLYIENWYNYCTLNLNSNYCKNRGKNIQLKIMHPFNYKMAFYNLFILLHNSLFFRIPLYWMIACASFSMFIFFITPHIINFCIRLSLTWLNVKFYLDFRIFRQNEAMLMRNEVSLFLYNVVISSLCCLFFFVFKFKHLFSDANYSQIWLSLTKFILNFFDFCPHQSFYSFSLVLPNQAQCESVSWHRVPCFHMHLLLDQMVVHWNKGKPAHAEKRMLA